MNTNQEVSAGVLSNCHYTLTAQEKAAYHIYLTSITVPECYYECKSLMFPKKTELLRAYNIANICISSRRKSISCIQFYIKFITCSHIQQYFIHASSEH